jgi:hypothetical protein
MKEQVFLFQMTYHTLDLDDFDNFHIWLTSPWNDPGSDCHHFNVDFLKLISFSRNGAGIDQLS